MEGISKEVFESRNNLVDERFARDKCDIQKLDKASEQHRENIAKLNQVSAQMGELIKQHDEVLQDHDNRIGVLEHKPSIWFDRIISGAVAAVVVAIVSAMLSGKLL